MGNLLPQRDLAFLGPRGHQQVDYVWKLQYIRTEYGPSPTLSALLATFSASPSFPAPLLALLPRLLCFNPDLRACTEEAARLLEMNLLDENSEQVMVQVDTSHVRVC